MTSIIAALLLTVLTQPRTYEQAFPDVASIEALADSLYAYGEYDAAALEYKRALYYSGVASYLYMDSAGGLVKSGLPVGFKVFEGVDDSLMTALKLALALYRNGETAESDSILYSMKGPVVNMARAVILIEEEDPYLAAFEIDSATCASLGAPAYRLRGWAYLEANDLGSAAQEFRKAGDGELAGEVESLKPRIKNPRTARWLSLLPGLGETYAGRPLFGLWAFLVNAGDTYLVISNVLAGRYVDAILAYTFLWQRFYSGSMANASRFAKEWNEREYAKVLVPLKGRYGEKEALSIDIKAIEMLDSLAGDSL